MPTSCIGVSIHCAQDRLNAYCGCQRAQLLPLEQVHVAQPIVPSLREVRPRPFPLTFTDFVQDCGRGESKQRPWTVIFELFGWRPVFLVL